MIWRHMTVKKICDKAIWLWHGKIQTEGQEDRVVDEYLKAQGQA